MTLFFLASVLLSLVPAQADTITVAGRGSYKGDVLFQKGAFYVQRTWIDGTPSPSRHTFALEIPASKVLAVEFNDKRVEECDSVCRMPANGSELDGGTVLAAMPPIEPLLFHGSFSENLPYVTVYPTFVAELEDKIGVEQWLNGNIYDRAWRLFGLNDYGADVRTKYTETCTFHPRPTRLGVVRLDFRKVGMRADLRGDRHALILVSLRPADAESRLGRYPYRRRSGVFSGTVLFQGGNFLIERTWVDRGTPSPGRHSFTLKIPAWKVVSLEINDKGSEECGSVCNLPAIGSQFAGGTVLQFLPSPMGNSDEQPSIPAFPKFTPKGEEFVATSGRLKGNLYQRSWRLHAIDSHSVHLHTPYSKTCKTGFSGDSSMLERVDFRKPASSGAAD